MSENVFSDEQYEEIFAELEKASDPDATLQDLAKNYHTLPGNLKNGLRIKFPKECNQWFKASVKADSKALTKKELVDRLIEIIDYPQEKWDHIRNTVAKSSFPQPFAQELYKQLVDNKLDDRLEELERTERIYRQDKQFVNGSIVFAILITSITGLALFNYLVNGAPLIQDVPTSVGDGVWETIAGAVVELFSQRYSPLLMAAPINIVIFPVIYIFNKIRKNNLKEKELAKNNYNNLLESLPVYLIDEINHSRLKGDKTTHFPQ